MGANELTQANNPQHGLTSCPTFLDWPVERNRAAAQGDGPLPRPNEAVLTELWAVRVRPTLVRRFGRGAA